MKSLSNLIAQHTAETVGEIFVPITGASDYMISNRGRVKSLARYIITKRGVERYKKEQYMTVSKSSSNGYLNVAIITDEGGRKQYLLHVLVAQHFVPGYEEGKECDHINGNKFDPGASNLRWVSKSENSKASFDLPNNYNRSRKITLSKNGTVSFYSSLTAAANFLGISKQRLSYAINHNKLIDGYRILASEKKAKGDKQPVEAIDILGNVMRFESQAEAVRKVGASLAGIHRCLTGKKLTHAGFKWKAVAQAQVKPINPGQSTEAAA